MRRNRPASRSNRRKGAWLVTLSALFALCAVIAAGVYLARKSSFFGLDEIVVLGNKRFSEKEIADLMGVRMGQNLFALSSERAASRLMASPWIRDARIRKEIPRRLLVRVEEAVPVALLKGKSGLALVDGRGNELEKLRGEPVSFLPVIVSPQGDRGQAFQSALNLAAVMKDSGLAAEKSHVEIYGFEKGAEEIAVKMDGFEVKFGEGRYRDKLAMLTDLSGEVQKRAIEVDYIDLRFADRVIVKPVNAASDVREWGRAKRGR